MVVSLIQQFSEYQTKSFQDENNNQIKPKNQKNEKNMKNANLTDFQKNQKNIYEADSNLGDLLLNFLWIYGHTFDYLTNNISVLGKSPREHQPSNNLSICCPSIEDPNRPSNNIGKTTFRLHEIRHQFKSAFLKMACQCHCTRNQQSLLSYIIPYDELLDKQRERIARLYPTPHHRDNANIMEKQYRSEAYVITYFKKKSCPIFCPKPEN